MLSCLETADVLTILKPSGGFLRIPRSDADYMVVKDIVKSDLPGEQAWKQIEALRLNPLQSLMEWCARFKIRMAEDGDFIRLNDMRLFRRGWLPLLERTRAAGGTPVPVLSFAARLSAAEKETNVGGATLHLSKEAGGVLTPKLVTLMSLHKDARLGDVVHYPSSGDTPFLVSFDSYALDASGNLVPVAGSVLAQVKNRPEANDILNQPAILGFNQTYRCSAGTVNGWLEDLSFDSLQAARTNAKEIVGQGFEARIINRITGDTVSVQ